jgi:FkbM family methyltransferase
MKFLVSLLVSFLRRVFYNTPIKNWRLTAYLYSKIGGVLVGNDPFPIIEYRGMKIMANGADVISTSALVNDHYETFTLDIFDHLIRNGLQKRSAESYVFADIGANIGIFTIAAGTRHAGIEIHAFEPNPVSYQLLARNVEMNALKNVTLNNSAVGEATAVVSLDISSSCSGMHSIYSKGAKRIDVPVVSLDEYFANQRKLPHLLKVDVEGYEPRVLAGMSALLQKGPAQIILEFHPKFLKRGNKAPEAFLNELTHEFDAIYCLDEIVHAALPFRSGDAALERTLGMAGYNLLLIKGEVPAFLPAGRP